MENKKSSVPKLRFPGFTGAWEQRRLGEVADVRDGTHDSPKYINEGYPLLTSKNVGDGYINYDDVKYVSENDYVQINKRSKVDVNDILMGMIGTIGNLALIREEPDFAIKNVALIKHTSNFDYQFLFQELQTSAISKELLSGMDGGTQKFVSLKKIRNLSVMLPSENEQKKIGSYLMRFDSLIALHQRKLEHLKEQKKGLLQKMFPKNGEVVPEVRFPGFTDDWEQRKLREVVNFLDTLRKPLEGAKRVKGPYPYYGASGIVDYVDGYLFDEELILLSEDGANITERNYPVCFLASGKYWVNNHAHVLKIKEDNDNNFICNSLERKDYTKYNTGMAMPKLNKETCKGIPIMCPNYDEQKKIGNYFRKFDTLITLHQRKLEHLKLMKKGLLQQMFV